MRIRDWSSDVCSSDLRRSRASREPRRSPPKAGEDDALEEEVPKRREEPDGGEHEEQGVEAVEEAAVAGEDRAHVLDAEVALHEGLAEVADGGGERDDDTDQGSPGHGVGGPEADERAEIGEGAWRGKGGGDEE